MPVELAPSPIVEAEVYAWQLHDLVGTSAYWLGEWELGEASARKAVEQRPGDARLQQNLSFYLERKKPK